MQTERNGVIEIIGEDGRLKATVERIYKGTSVVILDENKLKAFTITEEVSKSGGKIIRAIAKNGYETVHYEA